MKTFFIGLSETSLSSELFVGYLKFFKAKSLTVRILSCYHSMSFGQVAQLVEQRTENPCVGGSNPLLPIMLSTYLTDTCIPI